MIDLILAFLVIAYVAYEVLATAWAALPYRVTRPIERLILAAWDALYRSLGAFTDRLLGQTRQKAAIHASASRWVEEKVGPPTVEELEAQEAAYRAAQAAELTAWMNDTDVALGLRPWHDEPPSDSWPFGRVMGEHDRALERARLERAEADRLVSLAAATTGASFMVDDVVRTSRDTRFVSKGSQGVVAGPMRLVAGGRPVIPVKFGGPVYGMAPGELNVIRRPSALEEEHVYTLESRTPVRSYLR